MDKPLLNIRAIRAIAAVAAQSGLARASSELNTSQSSLSRHIAAAETAVGHTLFQRGWMGMEPTSHGEIVIATCRQMIVAIDTAQAALQRAGARTAILSQHLTWEMLEVARAVRLTGSTSAAAMFLQTPQPNISRALGKLATAIGRPAFRRTRGGMTMTQDAEILCALQERLLDEITRLPMALAALHGEVTGRIAVGLLPFSEQDAVAKMFGQILHQHKHIQLQVVTGSYAMLMEGLRQGELDFVLGILRGLPEDDTLQEMPLYKESFEIVASDRHKLSQRQPELKDLLQENWIVAPHGTPSRQFFEEWLIDENVIPPAQTCEIVTFTLAEQTIMHSDGIGLLTYSPSKRVQLREGLVILPIPLPERHIDIGLTFLKRPKFTSAQEVFWKIVMEHWGSGQEIKNQIQLLT